MKKVAEKTLAKIDKEQTKLDSIIVKKNELTADYQVKLAEYNAAIKEQETIIAGLRKQEKAEKLDAVASLIGKSGVTVDDLLSAVESGDLYSIQEIIENGGKSKTAKTAEPDTAVSKADSEDTNETSDEGTPDEEDSEAETSAATSSPYSYSSY